MSKYITIQIPQAFYWCFTHFIESFYLRNSIYDALCTFINNPINTDTQDSKTIPLKTVAKEQAKLCRKIRELERKLEIVEEVQLEYEEQWANQEIEIKQLQKKIWELEGLREESDTDIPFYGNSNYPTDEDADEYEF